MHVDGIESVEIIVYIMLVFDEYIFIVLTGFVSEKNVILYVVTAKL